MRKFSVILLTALFLLLGGQSVLAEPVLGAYDDNAVGKMAGAVSLLVGGPLDKMGEASTGWQDSATGDAIQLVSMSDSTSAGDIWEINLTVTSDFEAGEDIDLGLFGGATVTASYATVEGTATLKTPGPWNDGSNRTVTVWGRIGRGSVTVGAVTRVVGVYRLYGNFDDFATVGMKTQALLLDDNIIEEDPNYSFYFDIYRQISQTERDALETFFISTLGPDWSDKTNWLRDPGPARVDTSVAFNERGTECTWFGVDCGSAGDTVEALFLYNNNLRGVLPPELADLSNLVVLDVGSYPELSGSNYITGAIPPELAALSNLEGLFLSNNGFSGEIPVELFGGTSARSTGLFNLLALDLTFNNLTGTIPPEIGNLTSLEYLGLGFNFLSGAIPAEIGALTNLQILWLGDISIFEIYLNLLNSGLVIDDTILRMLMFMLTEMPDSMLNMNNFTGPIPSELSQLTLLHGLWLGDLSWIEMMFVDQPEAYGRNATGRAASGYLNPENASARMLLRAAAYVEDKILSRFSIVGAPADLVKMADTQSENPISEAELRANIRSATPTKLTGPLPDLSAMTPLEALILGNNQLTGDIPAYLGALPDLRYLSARKNLFTGSLPEGLNSLNYLNLSDNQLTGELPDLTAPAETGTRLLMNPFSWGNGLVWLNLANNDLSGALPTDWSMTTLPDLSILNLNGNQFTGALPLGLFTHEYLFWLTAGYNYFDALPDFTGQESLLAVSGLEWLNLEGNKLGNEGANNIPAWLGSLPYLWSLYLGNNAFGGVIPSELGNLTGLEHLSLWGNSLVSDTSARATSGEPTPIPLSFQGLYNLARLDLSQNQLTGVIPSWLGYMYSLVALDLSGNGFVSGIDPFDTSKPLAIPYEFSSLENLMVLNLAENSLDGRIPYEIFPYIAAGDQANDRNGGGSGMYNLVRLNLSRNAFSGEIPYEICYLPNLARLNLSHNQLTGLIPADLAVADMLTGLDLSHNQLHGNIPFELGDLFLLFGLNLSYNQLTGEVPESLRNCEFLETLNLRNNRLSGPLPDWMGDLVFLQILALGHNDFSGAIPDWSLPADRAVGFTLPEHLMVLNLANLHLTGEVPSYLGNFTKLAALKLHSNMLHGPLPTSLANLTALGIPPLELMDQWEEIDFSLDIRWNALYTDDTALADFLNTKQREDLWENTQTVAPAGLSGVSNSTASIDLSWTPITYTDDAGGYAITDALGNTRAVIATTADKTVSGYSVTGLSPNTAYGFFVNTLTQPHANNRNTVSSDPTRTITVYTQPITHEITASATTGGTIDPSGVVTVQEGLDKTFDMHADSGFRLAEVIVDGAPAGNFPSYTFTGVAEDHTIMAVFDDLAAARGMEPLYKPGQDFLVTVTFDYSQAPSALGLTEVIPSGWQLVGVGGANPPDIFPTRVEDNTLEFAWTTVPTGPFSFTYTVLPPEGSTGLARFDGQATYRRYGGELTWPLGASDTNVQTYTVTATAGPGGSIAPSGSFAADHGSGETFTITPDTGHHVLDIKLDGVSQGAATTFELNDITTDHTVEAFFEPDSFTITTTAGPNGVIDPSGPVAVSYGGSASFGINPDEGYHVEDVKVDGASVGAVNFYQFNDVAEDHTIEAVFAIDIYTITATAGPNGAIDPAGAVNVTYGDNQTFNFLPNEGYEVDQVNVDGHILGPQESFTFVDVQGDGAIHVTFKEKRYTIATVTVGAGQIDPPGPVSVVHGAGQTFNFYPETGHHVQDVQVDGASIGAAASYTFSEVTANHTLTVVFALNSYAMVATAGPGGSIMPSGELQVMHGQDITFAFQPNEGYDVSGIFVDGASVSEPISGRYTFSNVTAAHSIEVAFSNQAPTANAGPDQQVLEGDTVLLNALGSTDTGTGRDIAGYYWEQTGGPTVTLSHQRAPMSNFVAPSITQATDLTFELTVTDNGGATDTDTVVITINDNGLAVAGAPAESITIQSATPAKKPLAIDPQGTSGLVALEAIDPDDVPASANKPQDLPFGLLKMEIKVASPGDTATVDIYLSEDLGGDYGYYKYNSTTGEWIDLSSQAVYNTVDGRTVISLTLTDGGPEDMDGVANGVIVDPSGPGRLTEPDSFQLYLPPGNQQADYMLVSVPLVSNVDDLIGSQIGEYDSTLMRIGFFDAESQSYNEYDPADEGRPEPGDAAWMLFRNGKTFTVTGTKTPTVQGPLGSRGYFKALQNEWNMIGNPFSFPIAVTNIWVRQGNVFERIEVGDITDPVFWQWKKTGPGAADYAQGVVLAAGEAGFIYNHSGAEAEIFFEATEAEAADMDYRSPINPDDYHKPPAPPAALDNTLVKEGGGGCFIGTMSQGEQAANPVILAVMMFLVACVACLVRVAR